MGCHNCTPNKPVDDAKPLRKHSRVSLRMSPESSQSVFGAEKLYQSTVGRDSLDKVFKKLLQSYQTKAIPFTQVSTPDSHSTHETSLASSNNNSFRLQRELKLAAEVLPVNTGSSIFLFVNESDPSMLKALITGPAFTPYAHGLFEFDIFLQESTDLPPRVQFNTNGNGTVSFSAYLPANGIFDLACLESMPFTDNDSSSSENNQNISNLVLSLQNLLRASGIFGASGLMPESGEGMREYKAYCNVLKYATIQYSMLEYLENAPPELAEFVQTYFYVKKDLILKECKKWLVEAQIDNGLYDNIVAAQNPELADELRNGAYFVRLTEAVTKLEGLMMNINKNQESLMMSGFKKSSIRQTILA